VREGQEQQGLILSNDIQSEGFAEFVHGLCWSVPLQTHAGYIGGLERNLSVGDSAPYFASPSVELIFHDITRMPTNKADPQQIHKVVHSSLEILNKLQKRHVGNDHVHVVWSENSKDYDPLTITSKFGNVVIIVYPLPTGLYRIQVFRKDINVFVPYFFD
jgi:hypothetical protein